MMDGMETAGLPPAALRDFATSVGQDGAPPNGCAVEKGQRGIVAFLIHWERTEEGLISVGLYRSPDAYYGWTLSLGGTDLKGYTESSSFMGIRPPRHQLNGRRSGSPDLDFCLRNLRDHPR